MPSPKERASPITRLPWLEALKILHGPEDGLHRHPGALLLLVPPAHAEQHRKALTVVLRDPVWGQRIDRRTSRVTSTLDPRSIVKSLGEIVRTMVKEQGRTDVLATYRGRDAWWRKNVPVLIALLAGPYPHAIQLLRELEGMGSFDDTLWEPARALGPRGGLAHLLATVEALRHRLEQVRNDPTQTGEPTQWRGRLRRSNEGNWKRRLMSRARAILAKAGVKDLEKQTELLEIIALQVPATHLDELAADP